MSIEFEKIEIVVNIDKDTSHTLCYEVWLNNKDWANKTCTMTFKSKHDLGEFVDFAESHLIDRKIEVCDKHNIVWKVKNLNHCDRIDDSDSTTCSLKEDVVNNPSHYKHHDLECIEEIEIAYGIAGAYYFCLGNAWKYRYRAGQKDNNSSEQDNAKSDWYMKRAKYYLDNYEIVHATAYPKHNTQPIGEAELVCGKVVAK